MIELISTLLMLSLPCNHAIDPYPWGGGLCLEGVEAIDPGASKIKTKTLEYYGGNVMFTLPDGTTVLCEPVEGTIMMDVEPVNPYNMPDIPLTDEWGYIIKPFVEDDTHD